jgi:hypothetical protein
MFNSDSVTVTVPPGVYVATASATISYNPPIPGGTGTCTLSGDGVHSDRTLVHKSSPVSGDEDVVPTLSVANLSASGGTIAAACSFSDGTLATWADLTLVATLVGSLH